MSRRDPPIELFRIPGKGRAVIATRAIKKGELVERCPVYIVRMQDCRGAHWRYVFYWGKRYAAVALGLGSIYNHSNFPNLHTTRRAKQLEIAFWAAREIFDGEELTHNYGYLPLGYVAE